MAYRVELAKNAESELEELYLWVIDRAPSQGAAWYNGLEQAILSLSRHPERCSIAPEKIDPHSPIRILRYGRRPFVYRIFFTIDDIEKVVRVIHLRRGTRREPVAGELTR
jgi:plasmid stabilization system protein ParE